MKGIVEVQVPMSCTQCRLGKLVRPQSWPLSAIVECKILSKEFDHAHDRPDWCPIKTVEMRDKASVSSEMPQPEAPRPPYGFSDKMPDHNCFVVVQIKSGDEESREAGHISEGWLYIEDIRRNPERFWFYEIKLPVEGKFDAEDLYVAIINNLAKLRGIQCETARSIQKEENRKQ